MIDARRCTSVINARCSMMHNPCSIIDTPCSIIDDRFSMLLYHRCSSTLDVRKSDGVQGMQRGCADRGEGVCRGYTNESLQGNLAGIFLSRPLSLPLDVL